VFLDEARSLFMSSMPFAMVVEFRCLSLEGE